MFWVLVTVFEISVALAFGFIAGFGKSVVSDELVGRDGGGTTRRPHSAPLIAYYRAKFSSLASGRLPPRNRRREFLWPAIDHIPKRQYALVEL